MKFSKPDVSVVMSVYNGARYLRQSIESILSQEDVDFEFIIVNDGSHDESGDILAEYAARDSRIRVIEQENKGLTHSLIRACGEARGEYIARQDSDDLSLPARLQKLHDLATTDDKIVLVSSWALMFGPKNELLCEMRRPTDPIEATKLLLRHRTGPPGHGTVMFRKSDYEKVEGYRPQFYFSQDSDLWLRLCDKGLIAYYPEFLYAFQYDLDSISSARRANQRRLGQLAHECRRMRLLGRDEAPALSRAEQISPPFKPLKARDRSRGPYFVAGCLRAYRDHRALSYYWLAIKRRPWFLAAWVGLIYSWLSGRSWAQGEVPLKAFNSIDSGSPSN